jgi:hypothetical protein
MGCGAEAVVVDILCRPPFAALLLIVGYAVSRLEASKDDGCVDECQYGTAVLCEAVMILWLRC